MTSRPVLRADAAPHAASDEGLEPPLLEVRDLHTEFRTRRGAVRAVNGVSFSVRRGEVFAVVGESGCGKTATAMSILGILPEPAGKVVSGQVLFEGEDLLAASPERLRSIRGDRIAMVFQEPTLNPVARVGYQVAEVLREHRDVSRHDAWERAVELLDLVGIPHARERARDYPHLFSGGMRQRVMIAMAIALHPKLLIADEPTTALDVTIQAQVLDVLLDVKRQLGMAVLLITHDLGVVAGVAQRVMVMYAGRKVEEGDIRAVYNHPKHPYTRGLLASTSRLDRPRAGRIPQIPGAPPSLIRLPAGCRFAPRCPLTEERCRAEDPPLRSVGSQQWAACHLASPDDDRP